MPLMQETILHYQYNNQHQSKDFVLSYSNVALTQTCLAHRHLHNCKGQEVK